MNNNYKVLIADDELEFHQKIRFALRQNYEFEGATTEKEVFEKLKKYDFDLILLDLDLGYGDFEKGLPNIQKIKKLYPNLPVVIATNDSRIQTAVEAMKKGATYFFYKMEYDTKFWNNQIRKFIEDAKARAKNTRLKVTIKKQINTEEDNFIAKSDEIKKVKKILKKLAELTDVNLLIRGETGTGKEISAKYLHSQGPRKDKPFVAVNLAAIPTDLLASALFGHKKGAFTGATSDHTGFAEEANGGILFLDEIGDIPLDFQVKLLRFLEDKKIRPVGGTKDIQLDIQILSATNRNLEKAIEDKKFRADLFQRLNQFDVELPPLRERKKDIIPIAEYFLGDSIDNVVEEDVKHRLLKYDWSGNIRELKATIDSMVIRAQIMDLEKVTMTCLPKKIQQFEYKPSIQIHAEEIDHDTTIALKELKAVEEALIKEKRKSDAAKVLGKDDQQLRYMVKIKYFKKYPELFNQFPNICKAYKLNP